MADLQLAYKDELTGVGNRRFLTELFASRWDELRREHRTVSVIIADLDSFKAINDTYGHPTGDQALRATVALLREHFRDSDIIVRFGGDEFVIVLPGAGAQEATALAERARHAGADNRFVIESEGKTVEAPIEFSVGVADRKSVV